jgi:hypothetical protein
MMLAVVLRLKFFIMLRHICISYSGFDVFGVCVNGKGKQGGVRGDLGEQGGD